MTQEQNGANYRATVAYDGTRYHGFQWQPKCITIQGELSKAAERITQERVHVIGAGRTDAGVHALGQVISFRCHWRHADADLERALDAVLPEDISVRDVAQARDDFHARYSAFGRTYIYTVYTGPWRQPLLERYVATVRQPLDLSAMQAAASCVVGRHDMAALGQSPSGKSTVRQVTEASWEIVDQLLWPGAPLLRFRVRADGFLRGMVRRMVGSLLEVGQGNWSREQFQAMLVSRDIGRAAPPAPASGLCLLVVDYEQDPASVGAEAL